MSRSLFNSSLNLLFSTLASNSFVDFITKSTINLSIFDFLESSLDASSTSIKRFISEVFLIANEDKKKKEEREKKREDKKIKNKKKEENKNIRFR